MTLTEVSLFAGVGGITLAAERAGMRTALACEKDKHCRAVLAERFPDATIHADVRTLTADDLRRSGAVPDRTVISAGWPCQGNSVAGARGGMADPRSGLWSHVARLLGEFRPRWFVGENVPGLLSVNDGSDFATVLQDLAELGYGFTWRVLDARYFGVPQRRRRVILVGHLGDTGATSARVLLESEGVFGDSAAGGETGEGAASSARESIASGGVIAPALTARYGKGTDSDATDALVVAFHVTQDPISGPVSPAMGTGNAQGCATIGVAYVAEHVTALDTQQGGHLVAIHENQRGEINLTDTAALTTGGGKPGQGYPAVLTYALGSHAGAADGDQTNRSHAAGGPVGLGVSEEEAYALRAGRAQSIASGLIVRRLTPLECERLQGFPDCWTDVPGTSDSQRYRQMGNAVAVPVLEWTMRRLVAVDASLERAA